MGGFEAVQHTADVCIRVWGGSWRELLEEAARGMVSHIVDINSVSDKETREIEIEGEDEEELLLNWLREIIYLIECGMVFCRFRVREDNFSDNGTDNYRFYGSLGGEKLDPSRHDICTDIKAVTRHGLSVKKKDDLWETFILFDV